jgi:hypothetical protein
MIGVLCLTEKKSTGLKRVGYILLIFLVLLQCSMKTVIVAHYWLNKKQISVSLCENKSKPELKCEGKCYLKKTLKAEQSHQAESESDINPSPDFFPATENFMFYPPSETDNSFTLYLFPEYNDPLRHIFHPPRFA